MEPDIKGDGLVSRFIARHSAEILDMLLKDRTTGRNIIWADDEYAYLGDGYTGSDEITVERITGANAGLIRTRIEKERGHQAARTRARAEVFTPSWLCNRRAGKAGRRAWNRWRSRRRAAKDGTHTCQAHD